MTTIMIETPIAFGLTMIVCLALFFYCWRIRKIRHRFTAVQVAAAPLQLPTSVQETGIKREVIVTFPTVNANELKMDLKDGLQCPICLVEYAEAEVLRKLPLCGHVFHIRCVDSWLEKQVTCPVCRIVLTAVPRVMCNRSRHSSSSMANHRRVIPETRPVVPAWVLVNRPMPLPPAIAEEELEPSSSSSSSDAARTSGGSDVELQPLQDESPLLERHNGSGWGVVYLERSQIGGLSFRAQTKECVDHSSISERWMTESFLFGISDDSHRSWSESSCKTHGRHAPSSSWSSRSVNSRSWDFNHPTIHSWQTEFEDSADEVFESRVLPHRPLTMSPERCSFEFLPIITGPCGDYSSRQAKSPTVAPWVPGESRHSYNYVAQL